MIRIHKCGPFVYLFIIFNMVNSTTRMIRIYFDGPLSIRINRVPLSFSLYSFISVSHISIKMQLHFLFRVGTWTMHHYIFHWYYADTLRYTCQRSAASVLYRQCCKSYLWCPTSSDHCTSFRSAWYIQSKYFIQMFYSNVSSSVIFIFSYLPKIT